LSSPPVARRHVAALDGLRAFAVIAVIIYHTMDPTPWLAVDRAVKSGWVGVDLFFVLSGFLITGILLDSKGSPRFFRNFYIRRTLRIFPLYYAVLVAALLVAPHFLPSDSAVHAILDKQGWLWAYAQNIEELRHGGKSWKAGWLNLTHLWSLSVEEQFYLVWPAVVYLTARRSLAAVAAAIVIGAPLLRAAMLHAGTPPQVIYAFTLCRLDTLAVGALLAVLVRSRPELVTTVVRALLAIGGIAVLAIAIATGGFDAENYTVQIIGYTAAAALFGGVVLRAAQPRTSPGLLGHPILTTIGRYSYGIYIFSELLDPLFNRIYSIDRIGVLVHSRVLANVGFTAFALAASTGIAAISWHVFEKRFLALKDRWAPVERAAPAASAS
jgi:peptidoglycan/LPS O-acetylase OafA/YrhL